MAIYRGPGGPGDATTDAASEAALVSTLVTQAQTAATNASNSASNASTSATNAANSATAAANSATSAAASLAGIGSAEANAAASASAAATSATNAATSASNANTSATNASTSASQASTAAGQASASASNAATSETNAQAYELSANEWATKTSGPVAGGEYSAKYHAQAAATSASNAEASYDSFDDRYLGSKSSAPTLDNDGNTLLTGALYWNSSNNTMYVWNGTAWAALAGSVSGVSSFNTRTGSVTLNDTDVSDALAATTGAIKIPVGTQAQRPTPTKGMFRFNDDTDSFEGYDGAAWGAIGGGGGFGLLPILNRSGSVINVPLTNGFLAITNRSGGTINVPIS